MKAHNTILISILSTTSIIVGVISSGITNRLDRIVINIFISEQVCPRCGRKDSHVNKAHEICPECQTEVDAEEYEDDDEDAEEFPGGMPYQHGPMMYR